MILMRTTISILLFFLFSSAASGNFEGNKLICSKLSWGFEFISANKVKVISSNFNNETSIKEYFYNIDPSLPFVNIYIIENNIKDLSYSIHTISLRVDIWTMTSGGNTTREFIPEGFCKFIEVENLFEYIENLKKN